MTPNLSWNDRFALIDHYSPSDQHVCVAFGVSADELSTARELRDAGTFTPTADFSFDGYDDVFNVVIPEQPQTHIPIIQTQVVTPLVRPQATVHSRPETATKRQKVPQKRGRKGDKITKALLAVPTTPVPVDQFSQTHGVSLAVLRQSKRFMEGMDASTVATIGKVNVRQDKNTKRLMIWRDVVES